MVRKTLAIDLNLLLDHHLSPTAKFIYQILKTFQHGQKHSAVKSVTVTHRELTRRCGLSQNTVVKALNQLERTGWIRRERNSGAANKYLLTTPPADFK